MNQHVLHILKVGALKTRENKESSLGYSGEQPNSHAGLRQLYAATGGEFNPKRLKTRAVFALSLSLCLTLGACSTPSETFDCPAGKGVGCKSISEVNQMVNHRMVHQEDSQGTLGTERQTMPLSSPVIVADSLSVHRDQPSHSEDCPLSSTVTVHRIQEEPLKVWIAPFQDEQGNFHEGSVIHTVLKPGYWHLKTFSQKGREESMREGSVSEENMSERSSMIQNANDLNSLDLKGVE